MKTRRTFKAKKGQVLHLDTFYDFQGMLPEATWINCNSKGIPTEASEGNDDDQGLFLKDVKITCTIEVLE